MSSSPWVSATPRHCVNHHVVGKLFSNCPTKCLPSDGTTFHTGRNHITINSKCWSKCRCLRILLCFTYTAWFPFKLIILSRLTHVICYVTFIILRADVPILLEFWVLHKIKVCVISVTFTMKKSTALKYEHRPPAQKLADVNPYHFCKINEKSNHKKICHASSKVYSRLDEGELQWRIH